MKLRDSRRSKHTRKLLTYISSHIQNKQRVTYILTIQSGNILIEPSVFVLPDKHSRKSSDKESVIYHVVRYHMPELLDQTNYTYLTDKLIEGKYKFEFSYDKKTRRWFILNER